jgi:putative sigma-54 modulation protein
MQIDISGHHVEITPALRDYVAKRLSKLPQHFSKITSTHIVLSVEKLTHKAAGQVHVPGGILIAESECKDMYEAIDELEERLTRQIDKHKEKMRDHQHGEDEDTIR